MRIAVLGPNSATPGANLEYADGRFIVGPPHRSLSVPEVVELDWAGGLEWTDAATRNWFYQNQLSFVDQGSPSPSGARRGRWSWWVTGIVLVLGWTVVDFVGTYALCEMAETDEAVEAISYAGGKLFAAGLTPIFIIVLVMFLRRERR